MSDLFGNRIAVEEDESTPDLDKPVRLSRYAEFLVCAYLTKMGHHVLHVDTIGFDLVLGYGGNSYRVDVKATATSRSGPFKQSVQWKTKKTAWDGGDKTDRAITPNDADLLALFYIPLETVVFYPILKPVRSVGLPLSFVKNSGHGEMSLVAAIEKLQRSWD